jgi:uncharacterized protein YjhX (UPF0386 family)
MGAKAVCDCGAATPIQFAIALSKKDATKLGKDVQATRARGDRSSDVVCGACMSRRISEKRLIVAEVLKYSPIKLERVTFDTECVDCTKKLPFGTYAHFHAESGQAICTACGTKRGWTEKDRAMHSVKMLELKEDIKALHKRYVVEAQGLHLLEEKVDLHQVAQLYIELESKVTTAVSRLNSYLLQGIALPQESKILQELARLIPDLLSMAAEIKRELTCGFSCWTRRATQKMLQKVFAESDAETKRRSGLLSMRCRGFCLNPCRECRIACKCQYPAKMYQYYVERRLYVKRELRGE